MDSERDVWGRDEGPVARGRASLDFAFRLLSSSPSSDDVARAFADLVEHVADLAWLSAKDDAGWKAALARLGAAKGTGGQVDRLRTAVAAARKGLPTPRPVTEEDVVASRAWPEPEPEVLRLLGRTPKGALKASYANVVTVLRNDSRWASLRVNAMGGFVEWEGRACEEGPMVATTAQWMAGVYPGLDFQPSMIERALLAVGMERRYIPMQEYLDGLRWDGVPRLDMMASDYLGVSTSHAEFRLYSKYTRRFMISGVARAMRPGCKVDTALIFVGKQGAKKSTFFDALFGEWFSDSPISVGNKDAFINLSASWGYEASEMESLTARSVEAVKQFMSGRTDTYRPPYGKTAVKVPRHSVLCATTNKPEVLMDPTGHRRFWIMSVPDAHVVPVAKLRKMRDQLWAEAVVLWRRADAQGEDADESCRWWFTREEEESREGDMAMYQSEHPWQPKISAWLVGQTQVASTTEAFEKALGGDAADMTEAKGRDIARCMRAAGWTNAPYREGGVVVRRWRKESAARVAPVVNAAASSDDVPMVDGVPY